MSSKRENATAFLDDYANIAATRDGGIVAYWMDMRNPPNFGIVTHSGARTSARRGKRPHVQSGGFARTRPTELVCKDEPELMS
jgi:hypothetical protein